MNECFKKTTTTALPRCGLPSCLQLLLLFYWPVLPVPENNTATASATASASRCCHYSGDESCKSVHPSIHSLHDLVPPSVRFVSLSISCTHDAMRCDGIESKYLPMISTRSSHPPTCLPTCPPSLRRYMHTQTHDPRLGLTQTAPSLPSGHGNGNGEGIWATGALYCTVLYRMHASAGNTHGQNGRHASRDAVCACV